MDLYTASAAVGAGQTTITELVKKLSEFGRKREDKAADSSISLPGSIRDAIVQSDAFVENSLYDTPDILTALFGFVHQLYGGYIITALGLDQMVGGVRVRDMLRRIRTEGMIPDDQLIAEAMNQLDAELGFRTEGAKVVEPDPASLRVAAGKLLEVTFKLDKGEITIPVQVQLTPVKMPREAIGELIALNFSDSFLQRWRKWRAGLITFWSDFIGGQYELKRAEMAVRKDRTGAVATALRARTNALVRVWSKLIGLNNSNNIASSIMMITQPTFNHACDVAGVDFANAGARDRFFAESLMMMVLVVDNEHEQVTLYTNGLSRYAEYPFSAIEKAGGKGGGVDMKTLMALLGQGLPPRI